MSDPTPAATDASPSASDAPDASPAMPGTGFRLGASILSADWSRMGEELVDLERAGIDFIHWDVMDNRFVPNLTFGWDFIRDCRSSTGLMFEAHLMAHEPDRDVANYAAAGCERLIVQPEACLHVHRTLQLIREAGMQPGLALNPGTPLAMAADLLGDIDVLLIMTVNPGFGGQAFIRSMVAKIAKARRLLDDRAPHVALEVDGGIKPDTVDAALAAGATDVVCGSGLFGPAGKAEAARALRGGRAGRAASG